MIRSLILIALLLLVSATEAATTHTIRFGGGFGSVYEPKKLDVAVGDTIIWRGDFSEHPLWSTSVPAGVEPFNHSANPGITAFKYVVEMAGDYAYHCGVHSSTMTGTFTATAAAVHDPHDAIEDYIQAFVGQGAVKLQVRLAEASHVSARLLDHLGRTLNELTATTLPAGPNELVMDAHNIGSGMYFLAVRIDEETFLRRLILIK